MLFLLPNLLYWFPSNCKSSNVVLIAQIYTLKLLLCNSKTSISRRCKTQLNKMIREQRYRCMADISCSLNVSTPGKLVF